MCHGQMIGAALAKLAGAAGSQCGQCKRTIEPGESLTSINCKQNGEYFTLLVCCDCNVAQAREGWLFRILKFIK